MPNRRLYVLTMKFSSGWGREMRNGDRWTTKNRNWMDSIYRCRFIFHARWISNNWLNIWAAPVYFVSILRFEKSMNRLVPLLWINHKQCKRIQRSKAYAQCDPLYTYHIYNSIRLLLPFAFPKLKSNNQCPSLMAEVCRKNSVEFIWIVNWEMWWKFKVFPSPNVKIADHIDSFIDKIVYVGHWNTISKTVQYRPNCFAKLFYFWCTHKFDYRWRRKKVFQQCSHPHPPSFRLTLYTDIWVLEWNGHCWQCHCVLKEELYCMSPINSCMCAHNILISLFWSSFQKCSQTISQFYHFWNQYLCTIQ